MKIENGNPTGKSRQEEKDQNRPMDDEQRIPAFSVTYGSGILDLMLFQGNSPMGRF
jgi:hypothetical protein